MSKSAEDILKTAILLELRGKAFYTTAARETRSEAVRKIFAMMAEEEDAHSNCPWLVTTRNESFDFSTPWTWQLTCIRIPDPAHSLSSI